MEKFRAQVLWETHYSDVISGCEMMWCDVGRGAPYISLQLRSKMERGLRDAVGLDGGGTVGGGGIRCHSQFLDIWCRHCRDSSWQTEL